MKTHEEFLTEMRKAAAIARAVHSVFGVSLQEMQCRRRDIIFVHARCVFVYLAFRYTMLTTIELGNYLNRKHCTMLHENRAASNLRQTNKRFREMLEMVESVFINELKTDEQV